MQALESQHKELYIQLYPEICRRGATHAVLISSRYSLPPAN